MKDYIKLIRVKHWIKNGLIFIPLVCAGAINYSNVLSCIAGFFAFSFASSFIYIVNDIKDGNEMKAILQNERNFKNTIPEHIQKTIESHRKQKETIISKRKNETEERLYNEYLSIKSSNSIELEDPKKKSKNIYKTIYTQEEYDKKIEEMKNKINH